jgi:predicted transcriptional regulator
MVLRMRTEKRMNFTDEEAEFAHLLIEIGTRKNIAKILVFLAKTPEATSRAVERGADLRQPDVSIAMRYLMDQGWIRCRESLPECKGRPIKTYGLAKPIYEILECIGSKKKIEADNQLALIQKFHKFIRSNYNKLTIFLAPFYIVFCSIFSSEEMSIIFTF